MAVRSAFSAFISEKPHSSISDWVEILSGENYKGDDYDGLPELVESINLQAEGPGEACRAIRKKLKYGSVHRQLRTLTIMKVLVENCGPKFQNTFSNDYRLIFQIKVMATDHTVHQQVRRKLLSVLQGWHRQFKDEPSMKTVAALYLDCKPSERSPTGYAGTDGLSSWPKSSEREQRKEKEREDKEKERHRKEAEKKKSKERQVDLKKHKTRRPFDFEKEKPMIVTSVADASQASNNLVNALKLVNREQETVEQNARVQECLSHAKLVRKTVVRYIQLVENEELIGTLLDANERIIAALQIYDKLLHPDDSSPEGTLESKLAETTLKPRPDTLQRQGSIGQLEMLQDKQRAAIARSLRGKGPASTHPDLKDLNFNPLESHDSGPLQPPMRPSKPDSSSREDHGSLSDFSDYESSEENYSRPGSSPKVPRTSRQYKDTEFSNSPFEVASSSTSKGRNSHSEDETDRRSAEDDPFADPFADNTSDIGTPAVEKSKIYW